MLSWGRRLRPGRANRPRERREGAVDQLCFKGAEACTGGLVSSVLFFEAACLRAIRSSSCPAFRSSFGRPIFFLIMAEVFHSSEIEAIRFCLILSAARVRLLGLLPAW